MKKIFILLCIAASLAVYSQISIPETSSKGTITTQNGMIIEYKDLKFSKGKVTYKNVQNGQEEFLYENSVKAVQETSPGELSTENPAGNPVMSTTEPKKENSKLTDKYDIKNYLLQQKDPEYMKGKGVNNLGTAFLAGGAACFVVGGILNLSKANSSNVKNGESSGSPVPLIIGLVGAGVGVTLKLAGHSKMKEAINNYRNADASKFTPSYYVLNDSNGIGLMMKF